MIEWKGDEVKKKVDRAQKTGLNITVSDCLTLAKKLVNYDVGTLERSLHTKGAKKDITGYKITWGSFDVNYALWQEIMPYGKPYLRPASDRHYPELAKNIKKAM